MILSIHQPETFPQLGFFDKILASDEFVFLDSVKYRKNYFQNRNRIIVNGKETWLTLPVGKSGYVINEKKFDLRVLSKIAKTLDQNFSRSEEKSVILHFLMNYRDENLANFNIDFIKTACKLLGIGMIFHKSSDLKLNSSKGYLILEICKSLESREYLSGASGREYLDVKAFREENITLKFQKFFHQEYQIKGSCFVPYMSIILPLLTFGASETLRLIQNGRGYESSEDNM